MKCPLWGFLKLNWEDPPTFIMPLGFLGSRWGSERFGCGAGTLWATWPSEGWDGLRLIGDMENWWIIMIYDGQSYGHGWFRATSMIFIESLKNMKNTIGRRVKIHGRKVATLERFVFIRPVNLALSQVEFWSYINCIPIVCCFCSPLVSLLPASLHDIQHTYGGL